MVEDRWGNNASAGPDTTESAHEKPSHASGGARHLGSGAPRQTNGRQRDSSLNMSVWASMSSRYEWTDDMGDVAPRDEALEKELFQDNGSNSGLDFTKYDQIKVDLQSQERVTPILRFSESKLHPVMLDNLKLAGYELPTPIQKYAIPIIANGTDIIACAQTGSGKTAAFLVPTLSQLFGKAPKLKQPRPRPGLAHKFKAEPLVLILAPTRELTTQIFDESRKFCYRSMLRPCCIYGGADFASQRTELQRGCDLLVATPGRLLDALRRNVVGFKRVRSVILDEADRMLDLGFESNVRDIMGYLPEDDNRQTLMFSATFPKRIRRLAEDFLADDHVLVRIGRVGATASDILQKVMFVPEREKRDALMRLLLDTPPTKTLIFVKTKRGCDSLDDFLFHQKFPVTSIHSDRTQREREDALISFRTSRTPIMIATAVAARGLDIKDVMHVINYDLPDVIDEYVHRIGRTGRVGRKGLATSFWNESNENVATPITKLLIENDMEVPEFLQSYVPDEITFKSDDEEEPVQYTKSHAALSASGGRPDESSYVQGAVTDHDSDNWSSNLPDTSNNNGWDEACESNVPNGVGW